MCPTVQTEHGIPLSCFHATESGFIHLWVSRADDDGWDAKLAGFNIFGKARFSSVEAANAFLERSFETLFPTHRCTGLCTSVEAPVD
jgi:hypothetical protein